MSVVQVSYEFSVRLGDPQGRHQRQGQAAWDLQPAPVASSRYHLDGVKLFRVTSQHQLSLKDVWRSLNGLGRRCHGGEVTNVQVTKSASLNDSQLAHFLHVLGLFGSNPHLYGNSGRCN